METEHYRYCLRCNPSPGDYNCYCTAYDLDVQRQNMARDKPLVGRVTYANMVQVKSNLAPTGSAILFEVAEKGVDFISEMEMTAEEAFQSLAPKIGRPNDKEIKAKEFLLEMLKDGEILSSDCEERLEAAGFKKSTIKKAKKKAGVISRKQGFLWYWSLPMGDIPRE